MDPIRGGERLKGEPLRSGGEPEGRLDRVSLCGELGLGMRGQLKGASSCVVVSTAGWLVASGSDILK